MREELLRENSRRQMLRVAGYVRDDPERFGELMQLFLSNEYRVVQRAAWVVSTVAERHPTLIRPYLPRLVKALEGEAAHPSVHRNVMRLLQWVPIPERYEGKIYDIALAKIDDPTATTAVRAFAIEVAARIADGESVLLEEIRLVTERHLKDAKPAIMSKARNVLKIDAGSRLKA